MVSALSSPSIAAVAAAVQEGRSGMFERMGQAWEGYKDDPLTLLDAPWIQAVLWVVGALLAARVLNFVVFAVARRLAGKTSNLLDDQVLELLHGPLIKSVVLLGLWFAACALNLREAVLLWTGRGLQTVALVVWTVFSIRIASLMLRSASGNPKSFRAVESRTLPLFNNVARIVIVLFSVYVLIQVWGWDATGWAASAGVLTLAVGFAAQDTLSNLFAGVLILIDGPYRVGDYINLESGERGKVVSIGLRSTRLLTRDDVEIVVPNSVIGNARIRNETAGPTPKHRVRVKVSVAYGTDVGRLEGVLLDCANKVEHVCDEPEPRLRFRLMNESSLDFELLAWVPDPELRGLTLHLLNTSVHARLREEGIEIPFPQRDLHVKQMPSGGGPSV